MELIETPQTNTELNNNNKQFTICLNMIVKNESHIILDTLNNLTSKIIFDYWVICDTGSTDNTKELIQTFFHEKNYPYSFFIEFFFMVFDDDFILVFITKNHIQKISIVQRKIHNQY